MCLYVLRCDTFWCFTHLRNDWPGSVEAWLVCLHLYASLFTVTWKKGYKRPMAFYLARLKIYCYWWPIGIEWKLDLKRTHFLDWRSMGVNWRCVFQMSPSVSSLGCKLNPCCNCKLWMRLCLGGWMAWKIERLKDPWKIVRDMLYCIGWQVSSIIKCIDYGGRFWNINIFRKMFKKKLHPVTEKCSVLMPLLNSKRSVSLYVNISVSVRL